MGQGRAGLIGLIGRGVVIAQHARQQRRELTRGEHASAAASHPCRVKTCTIRDSMRNACMLTSGYRQVCLHVVAFPCRLFAASTVLPAADSVCRAAAALFWLLRLAVWFSVPCHALAAAPCLEVAPSKCEERENTLHRRRSCRCPQLSMPLYAPPVPDSAGCRWNITTSVAVTVAFAAASCLGCDDWAASVRVSMPAGPPRVCWLTHVCAKPFPALHGAPTALVAAHARLRRAMHNSH